MGIARYPVKNEEIRSIDAKLLYVTYSKFEHDWHSLPHAHPFAELCYVLRGNGIYYIEDEEYPVKEADFIVINPNVSHTERSEGEVPLEYIILGVEGLDFSSSDSNEHIIFNCRREHASFVFYMQTLLQEIEQGKPNSDLVCRSLLDILIVNLTRRSVQTHQSGPVVSASKECLKIRQYIEKNYTQDITLDTLADISHLNKFYLVHAFTQMFGCSPISLLCQVRIKASMELLASTNYSITDIAHSSGFSSSSYFAQCFQKHCNMTASAYRKACRQH